MLEGQHARLSAAALETLAIVAYKQPISRGQVSAIRGVDVGATLRTLLQRGYIAEVGRDPGPGNATLYGTTRAFLERLGIDSVADLPSLGDFVPAPDVVESLERGLRLSEDPSPGGGGGGGRGGIGPLRRAVGRRGRRVRGMTGGREPGPVDRPGERLQKFLARAGFGSRRSCEDLIAAGRVTVGGEPAALGRRVDPDRDQIAVDGVPVVVRSDLVYYLLNKPADVVTTAYDPQGRRTVLDLVPVEPRVFPVGRLDRDSEGLLLLTNDGVLTQRLTHPSHGVEKEYLVEVDGVPTPQSVRRLREGVRLEDGLTAPARPRGRGSR
ncbi:MAG: SMC-Scp complex subunit ScpB [Acidimicrobiia bacterium]|nr:SMC-Scp complex subunit ScpB [Acidimicrobiia bacterium]